MTHLLDNCLTTLAKNLKLLASGVIENLEAVHHERLPWSRSPKEILGICPFMPISKQISLCTNSSSVAVNRTQWGRIGPNRPSLVVIGVPRS
jgi:hypothetical protein